jgi:Ion channel
MKSTRALWKAYSRRRFGVLFATLLLALVGHPLFGLVAPREDVVGWLLALSLGAAVLGVEASDRIRPVLGLAGAFAAVRVASGALGSPGLFAFGQVLWASTCLLVTGLLVWHALRPGPVDSERIFAALDAYLLAAASFGVMYWLLDRIWPGSFGPDVDGAISSPDALYLSLVTISTLGLGDLLPLSAVARSLVTLEAIGGQMYLAVLVARLVSLYTAAERRH